ncbi:MAG: DNA-protecting protein DprA [candidate division Zixibacteria bacterium]|nr:DNA-protecting protein DprA [candidate division Zixibacteria bacterium]
MSEVETKFALMLAQTNGIGPVKYQELTKRFRNYDSLVAEGNPDILQDCGLSSRLAGKLKKFDNWNLIDKILEQAEQFNVEIICLGQSAYPEALTNIYSPPPILYIKGDKDYLDKPAVAIVGSRTPTAYGRSMASKITAVLAARGLVIISGLAWGIDAEAHKAALDAGGATGAVFGCGIDNIYPGDHRDLAEKILKRGFWISEFPFGTDPERHNFPRRNRIISGLSNAVVIVEAAARSGALVTANIAADQGKDVFAVPGQADNPKSDGTISLIKQGAFVATSADDILESLGWEISEKSKISKNGPKPVDINLDSDEQKVCDLIGNGPLHFDELVRHFNYPSARISAILLKLELAGLVARRPGNYLART